MKTAARFSLERIAALDRAIRAGEFPNAATIANLLEVGQRTVQRDVEFMRDRLEAPIEFDRVRNGYFYRDPSYKLSLLTLAEGELVALFLAERVLRQYEGTPYAGDLARAFRKLTLGLPERVTIDLAHLDGALSFRTTASTPPDPALFDDLFAAIRTRRRIRISYASASSGEVAERDVDPYHLASVDGHWYIVGHCHRRGAVRMFAPGRIRSLRVVEEQFEAPADFRIGEYLAASFGVLRGAAGESYRVRLRFTGPAARYAGERVWHPSQDHRALPDGAVELTWQVGHLREVERFALSWGDDCEVLEPAELREAVAAIHHRAAARYRDRANEGHRVDGEAE